MQTQSNVKEAKPRLSQIIKQVKAGGDAVIARAGRPVVRLLLVDDQPPPRRVPGRLAGRFRLPDEGSAPILETPPELVEPMEGR